MAQQCSVIQGSKLSGILYTIYTNEIPQLYTLMQDNIYTEITGMPTINTKGIEHLTVNFVDDSTNLIITKDPTKLQTYLNGFYILLQKVYNTNKLIINQETREEVNARPYIISLVSSFLAFPFIMA